MEIANITLDHGELTVKKDPMRDVQAIALDAWRMKVAVAPFKKQRPFAFLWTHRSKTDGKRQKVLENTQ